MPLDLKLVIVLYLICCKTQFLVLLVTFNLSSTQFYLFFSSFRIKNYKLCDQLPPQILTPPLIRRGTSGPRNSLSKSNPYIISCQIRYSEWWNNRNRNFKDKNQGIDNHGGVFSGTRLWEFGDIIFPTVARCHKRGYVAGARPCDHFRACEIILTWSLAPAACRGSDISFRTRKKGLHHHSPAGLWECCRARSLPALGSGSAPPAQRPPAFLVRAAAVEQEMDQHQSDATTTPPSREPLIKSLPSLCKTLHDTVLQRDTKEQWEQPEMFTLFSLP